MLTHSSNTRQHPPRASSADSWAVVCRRLQAVGAGRINPFANVTDSEDSEEEEARLEQELAEYNAQKQREKEQRRKAAGPSSSANGITLQRLPGSSVRCSLMQPKSRCLV